MIFYINDECLILNVRELENNDLHVVFVSTGNGVVSALIRSEARVFSDTPKRYYNASISYFKYKNREDLYAICELKLKEKAEAMKAPAF